MHSAIWKTSAIRIAEAVARGEVSAREVIDAHLARIALVNPKVNAVTNVLAESARREADAIDRRRAAGEELGPLAGVPFSVKENLDVAGSPTTHGVKALSAAMPSRDAPVIARLRAAGAIPLARTNLPDLSLRFHTRSQLYGDTSNPWDPRLSPGGSSGGEGVALADQVGQVLRRPVAQSPRRGELPRGAFADRGVCGAHGQGRQRGRGDGQGCRRALAQARGAHGRLAHVLAQGHPGTAHRCHVHSGHAHAAIEHGERQQQHRGPPSRGRGGVIENSRCP
jgi:hypothetical protein